MLCSYVMCVFVLRVRVLWSIASTHTITHSHEQDMLADINQTSADTDSLMELADIEERLGHPEVCLVCVCVYLWVGVEVVWCVCCVVCGCVCVSLMLPGASDSSPRPASAPRRQSYEGVQCVLCGSVCVLVVCCVCVCCSYTCRYLVGGLRCDSASSSTICWSIRNPNTNARCVSASHTHTHTHTNNSTAHARYTTHHTLHPQHMHSLTVCQCELRGWIRAANMRVEDLPEGMPYV